jgi:elongation factor G
MSEDKERAAFHGPGIRSWQGGDKNLALAYKIAGADCFPVSYLIRGFYQKAFSFLSLVDIYYFRFASPIIKSCNCVLELVVRITVLFDSGMLRPSYHRSVLRPLKIWVPSGICQCSAVLSRTPPTTRVFSLSSNREAATLNDGHVDISRTRNIGIIAHIDAGKTTTTERMLYYSGYTRRIGDVDDGSTVTDFLPAERARGITIQSAAITFEWPPKPPGGDAAEVVKLVADGNAPKSALSHHINLIDTPGHADFTFEVRRSLRILDGAVCVLDGVAGVEAQTEQVWKQAAAWKIPRIAYVNKLDRDGAAFGRTVREIGMRLEGWPAICQIPWWEGGRGRFTGIADVVHLQGLLYEEGSDGRTVESHSLVDLEGKYPFLAVELRKARIALVELLSEHDDTMVEDFLAADEDHLQVAPVKLIASLRRCLLREGNNVIPVFAGASFRNIGVQPLLDSVVNLLPSPNERPDTEVSIGTLSTTLTNLLAGSSVPLVGKARKLANGSSMTPAAISKSLEGCALAFKVVNDPRKGVLVYVRVYSGAIKRNSMLYNTNLKVAERVSTLLRMYASDAVPVQSIEAGQVGVIAGSKFARTGDTLVAYHGNKSAPPEPLDRLQLRPIDVPPPVFFASIEPKSLREEKEMHEKLALLLREDPSLHVTQDEDTGQTLLSGMGELHLEIAQDRLTNDLKANAAMGKIEIGYRETLQGSAQVTKIFEGDKSKSKGRAGCTVAVAPLADQNTFSEVEDENETHHMHDCNMIVFRAPNIDSKGRGLSSDDAGLPPNLTITDIRLAYLNGVSAALSRGPKYSYPLRNIQVVLTLDPAAHIFGAESTTSALTSAARLATIAAFKEAARISGVSLMEPVMDVNISVDEANMGSVMQDISSSRGGQIVSLSDDECITAEENDKPRINVKRIYAPPDPFESSGAVAGAGESQTLNLPRTIKARVPLKDMVGYLKHLRSITGGRGTFVMQIDKFEKMTTQREKAAISALRSD